jgi:16S rRNA (guanine1207-N2)-methyltransferase
MTKPVTSAASAILLEIAAPHDAAAWLVPGGEAALAPGLAADHPDAIVHWQPVDLRERLAVVEPPANIRIHELGTMVSGVQAAVFVSPPERDLARRWLLMARQALAQGGRLFLAGANAEGIRPVIADAETLFGRPVREGYGAKQRFAVFEAGVAPASVPAWADTPGIAPGTWQEFALALDGESMALATQAGVFAGARVDAGTRLLLDALPNRIAGMVLDAGCGAGVIGIAAALRGAAAVDMTDVNLLAIQAAAENVRRLSLPDIRVIPSDVYDALGDVRYDLIVSNPPFHRGKAVDYTIADRLIAGAPDHLAPGGTLLVVANAFLAYGKRMEWVFGRVETVAATRQFHVLQASDPR